MAERMSSAVLIFLLLLNGSAGILVASGLAADMQINPSPGMSEEMDNVVDSARSGFSPNAGIGDTLIAMFIAAISLVSVIVKGVFLAPEMFLNLGFPAWFVLPIFAPMYVVVVYDIIYVGTGRSM